MKDIAARFTHILGWLSQAVATFVARQERGPRLVHLGTQTYVEITPPSPHSTIPMATWLLLTTRLGRLAKRFRALVLRVEAGHIARPSPPRIRPAASRPPMARLPTERGWINARVPEAAPCAGTLIILLQDPDMPGFIAQAPQAGRLLRPICHALAVDLPDWLRLPPRPRRPSPRRPSPRHPEQSEGPTLPKRPAQARPLQRKASLPIWYPSPPRTRKIPQ